MIDLEGRLSVFTLDVLGADGIRVEQAQAVSAEAVEYHSPYFTKGLPPLRIVSLLTSPTVIVSSPGHRITELRLLTAESSVRLEAGIPVRVRIEDRLELGPGVTLFVKAYREGGAGSGWLAAPQAEVDADGFADLRLPAPGRWTFTCSIRVELSPRGVAGKGGCGETVAVVSEAGTATPVSLPLATQTVLDYLSSLDER